MYQLFNEAFFNSPLAITAKTYLTEIDAYFICNGIFSTPDITAHLSHALKLEKESVIFFVTYENAIQLPKGQQLSINRKDYQITNIRLVDGVGELQLCPI